MHSFPYQVNDLFKTEPTAITNFEAEIEEHLNLDDVVINTKKETPISKSGERANGELEQSSNSNLLKPVKVPKKQIVISDDENDDFERARSLKQSKLSFKSKPKGTLFSCLPKDVKQVTIVSKSECISKSKDNCNTKTMDIDVNDNQSDKNTEFVSPVRLPPLDPQISSQPVSSHPVCDVQHDVSFEDFPLQQQGSPSQKPENQQTISLHQTDDSSKELDKLVTHESKDSVSDDSENTHKSMSLFEAINTTCNQESSWNPPNLDNIPLPPSQVPNVEINDFSLICSQMPQTEISSPEHIIGRLTLETEPSSTKQSHIPDITDKFDEDELESTFFNEGTPLLNPQCEALFASLARIEKEQSATDIRDDKEDKFSDDDFTDISDRKSLTPVAAYGSKVDMEKLAFPCVPITTPSLNKTFKPIEASTPALNPLSNPTTCLSNFTPQRNSFLKKLKPLIESCEKAMDVTPRDDITNTSLSSGEVSPLVMGKRKRHCNILCTQTVSREETNEQKKSRHFPPKIDTPRNDDRKNKGDNKNKDEKNDKGYKKNMKDKKNKSDKNGAGTNNRGRHGKEAACPFVDSEAILSGEDEEEESGGGEEDLLSSSLEDFIDTNNDQPGIHKAY